MEPDVRRNQRGLSWLIVIGSIVLVGLSFWTINNRVSEMFRTVLIGGASYRAEIVSTPEAREKGLSGRSKLDSTDAMLFVFEESGYHPFWMKDMTFPIDIIWLDASKKVVTIERDVQPSNGFSLKTYKPDKMALYVLEVASGQAKNVSIGETMIVRGGEV